MTIWRNKKLLALLGGVVGLTLTASGALYYRINYKMSLKDYAAACLYLAVLDDEICRNELEGTQLGGKAVVLPPKIESLQARYHLFLEMNRGMSKAALDKKIDLHKHRLAQSKRAQGDNAHG